MFSLCSAERFERRAGSWALERAEPVGSLARDEEEGQEGMANREKGQEGRWLTEKMAKGENGQQ